MKIHVEPLPEGMWADGKRVDAFEEMYRRCYPQLVDLCRRSLCGRGDPEAVAQEAFVRAWSSLDRFSGVRPFWPWVATIARRLCIDHRRRLDREALHLHVAATFHECTAEQPDELVESDEEGKSVVLALHDLKPAERRVIALRDLNGWSYDEIAQFEGVTVESIRGALKRARASLRRSYARIAAGAPAVLGWRPIRALRDRLGRGLASIQQPMMLVGAGEGLTAVAAGFVAVASAFGVATPGPSFAPILLPSPPEAPAPADDEATSGGVTGGVPWAPSARHDVDDEQAPPAPEGLLGLPSDGATTPEDTVLTDITPSPSYSSDHTLFGVGSVSEGCASMPCAALFRSGDGGVRWTRLRGEGFAGGSLLLPPTFPADSRIFVAGPLGLQVSYDDGGSFRLAAPITGDASMSPGFATGDERVVIGQAPLWEYRADAQLTRPSAVVAPAATGSFVPMFSPRFAEDGLLFLGGNTIGSTGEQQSTVFRCVRSVCDGVDLPGGVGAPSLAASAAGDGTIVAWRGDMLYVSRDAGREFTRAAVPIPGAVRDVAFGPTGRLVVAVRDNQAGGSRGGLVASDDFGTSWYVVGAGSPLDGGAEAVTSPSARHIVVALSGTAGGGILCSTDGGTSWARRCAA